MKLGLFGINTGPCAAPETALRVARAAEAAGFESVWTGEHVVLPDPQVPPSPAPPHMKMLDPAVSLAFLAGATTTLRLGTGIIILPQRNPVVLAKELASVDVVSGGRLIVGIGAGYLEPEFAAIGADFTNRGARTDEYLDVLRALWTEEHPRFEGPTFRFDGIDAQPRPVQDPHPPLVIGGHSPPAFRRAVARGNGWYAYFQDPDGLASCLRGIEKARSEIDRPGALGPLEISASPLPGCDLDTARRYQDLGVERLTLVPVARSEEELLRFVDEAANGLLTKLG